MTEARETVMVHRCDYPVRVEVGHANQWVYWTADYGDTLTHCPRCGRRITHRSLRPAVVARARGGKR